MKQFTGYYFGQAAAETDFARDPIRFHRTYYDRWDLPDRVLDHERYLILGPKGSGKSAASKFVEQSWKNELGPHAVTATSVDFDELNRTQTPLTSLDKRLVSELTHLTDAAWKLFIGVRFLDQMITDAACSLSNDFQAIGLLNDLKTAGLASDDYPKVLRRVKERRVTFDFKVLGGERSSKEGETLSTGQVGDAVLELVMNARTSTRHLISIDGLDKAITDNPSYWQTVGALLRVADSFNRNALIRGASHAFLLVMCRSDVFRHVSLADAPKMAADGGVHLEWHAEAADPKNVLLWRYLSAKAEIEEEELLSHLPRSVKVGSQGGAVEVLKYLLGFTRYMPRDATLLFKEIQQAVRDRGEMSGAVVRQAADTFARTHLLNEITAEAKGLLPQSTVDRLQATINGVPRRIFNKSDMTQALEQAGVGESTPQEVGEYLFLQGAIGNYDPTSEYVQFYHRRDAYDFRPRGPWILHTGLVYALNKPW